MSSHAGRSIDWQHRRLVSIRRDVVELKNGLLAASFRQSRFGGRGRRMPRITGDDATSMDVIAVATVKKNRLGAARRRWPRARCSDCHRRDLRHSYGSSGNEFFRSIKPHDRDRSEYAAEDDTGFDRSRPTHQPITRSSRWPDRAARRWLSRWRARASRRASWAFRCDRCTLGRSSVTPRCRASRPLLAEFIGGLDEKFYESLTE